MDVSPVFLYLLPLVTLLVMGALGSTRRSGFWLTLLLSILLTPIGGFIVAILAGPRRPKRRAARPLNPK